MSLILMDGCKPAPGTPSSQTASAAPTQTARPAAAQQIAAPEAPAELDEVPTLVDECPVIDSGAEREIAAERAAAVPLKPGLTLSTTWSRTTTADEVECLTQVRGVDASTISVTASCSMPDGTQSSSRRVCRADQRSAYMFSTGAGDEPDVLKGTTMFSLSASAFGALKEKGVTRHRNVTMRDGELIGDLDGVLELEETTTLATTVNDRFVDLPVLRAAGLLRGTAMGKPIETRVMAAVLDDARFPLVLEYGLLDVGAKGFAVRYTKVSYPTEGRLEERLASTKQVDIYGIYFDSASDRIREESEVVIQEIATALSRNPDWILSINGHTDNVGGDAYNLDLSRRRSEAVRNVLVGRYGIAATRLTTEGHGASAPKDTNESPEGRARNRRVELIRR